MDNREVTTNEIMDFLKENMVMKSELKQSFDDFELKVDNKFKNFELKVDNKLNTLELKIIDAMDDKLSNLKGDLTILMRREDKKVSELINLLRDKKVIAPEEADRLLALQPFPQSSN